VNKEVPERVFIDRTRLVNTDRTPQRSVALPQLFQTQNSGTNTFGHAPEQESNRSPEKAHTAESPMFGVGN
jgi:hypothetical protein